MKHSIHLLRGAVLMIAMALVAGCLPSEPEPSDTGAESGQVQATPEQLAQAVIDMSHDMDQYGDSVERHIYTSALANTGPTALAPLLDYMRAPDTDQVARLFILQCVTIHLTPAYIPNITPMLKSDDQVIRAIGATALGSIQDESVVPLLKEAANDPKPRVAFSALSSLAMHGDAEARTELKKMYMDGTTIGDIPSDQINREVVRAIAYDAREEDLPVLMDALNQPYLEENQRAAIARALGRLGDSTAIPLLEKSIDLEDEPAYDELVKNVIAAIQARDDRA